MSWGKLQIPARCFRSAPKLFSHTRAAAVCEIAKGQGLCANKHARRAALIKRACSAPESFSLFIAAKSVGGETEREFEFHFRVFVVFVARGNWESFKGGVFSDGGGGTKFGKRLFGVCIWHFLDVS